MGEGQRILDRRVANHYRADLPSWAHGPEPATAVHPVSCVWVYQTLAIAAHLAGEQRDSTRYLEAAQAWRRLAD